MNNLQDLGVHIKGLYLCMQMKVLHPMDGRVSSQTGHQSLVRREC